ncbi:signal peptidase I [Bradymonas sediminis]|uniref:Signal peptidase I n=1 Tax=Bradymonas sediminis TaxID=1548548 RepID=A0A2Z4FJ83_9DELT|nr:signal peptidase I [Bradymonas sediminis]AWV88774.1 signal peptidase I [Bradymonas sediminis]TDP61772.1 signal peptidase I [Bradymonas sediminis]
MTTDEQTEPTYSGEIKARKKSVAVLLTFLCPGLGSLYLGQMMRGLVINLLFLMALEIFVIAWSVTQFFPLPPFLVFVGGWLLFSTLLALENMRRIDEIEPYILRGYNHWTLYLVTFLLTFLLPIALTLNFGAKNLWHFEPVHTNAMYPTIQAGDLVLTDRNAFRAAPPSVGDIVAVKTTKGPSHDFLRIVAQPDDIIEMEGQALTINENEVRQAPLQPEEVVGAHLDEASELRPMVEHNRDQRYVIATSPNTFSGYILPPNQLSENAYFLLADNRSQTPDFIAKGVHNDPRDSRNFGPVGSNDFRGVPRYILWSRGPDGSVRWDRIGLRVR